MAMASKRQVRFGFHSTVINRTQWDVPMRYHSLQWIGSGSFSQVCKADDRKTKQEVAIKKMTRPFQSDLDATRLCREIRILRHLNHENVVPLLDLFSTSTHIADFNDLYLVTAYSGYDLYRIMKMMQLDLDRIQFFTYQILRGLKYIHSAGIIHRDLKPNNIVINENNELRIVDFGLARQVDDSMTGYVATRWYRAPEIMYSWMQYTCAMDIWSVGCIMGEMILTKPLFPTNDSLDLFNKIIAMLGTPSYEVVSRIAVKSAKNYIQSLPFVPRKDFREVLGPRATPPVIAMIKRMLDFDPTTRISAEKALAHEYMSTWSDPDDEPACEHLFDNSQELLKTDIKGLRKRIFKEVQNFKPPMQQN